MARIIVHTPDTCGGEPRIDGTRLTCADVVLLLERLDVAGFFSVHEYLTRDDLSVCLDYCSREVCLEESPLNFCQGCSHDQSPEEKPSVFLSDMNDMAKMPDGSKGYSYLGTRENYEEEGAVDVWEVAGRWKQKLASSEDA